MFWNANKIIKFSCLILIINIFSYCITNYKNTNNIKYHNNELITFDTYKTYKELLPKNIEMKNNIEIFYGELTGYGPDCIGCIGITSCNPYPDVRNGNILYKDKKYGNVRILAADKKYDCGTIIEIEHDVFEKPITAIVLDRGSAIKGNLFDLLYESEKGSLGRTKDVKYSVLRKGW